MRSRFPILIMLILATGCQTSVEPDPLLQSKEASLGAGPSTSKEAQAKHAEDLNKDAKGFGK